MNSRMRGINLQKCFGYRFDFRLELCIFTGVVASQNITRVEKKSADPTITEVRLQIASIQLSSAKPTLSKDTNLLTGFSVLTRDRMGGAVLHRNKFTIFFDNLLGHIGLGLPLCWDAVGLPDAHATTSIKAR